MNLLDHTKRVALVLLVLSFFAYNLHASDNSVTLEDAISALDHAIQSDQSDDRASIIKEAAAELSFVMEQAGLESSSGEFALGNAYFLADDLGRAILHYRRGLAIDPTDEALRENLEHARSFVEPTVPEQRSGWSWKHALLSWRGVIDRWMMWYGSLALLGVASVLITIRVLHQSRFHLVRGAVVCAVLGFIGVSLLWYEYSVGSDRDGVVVILPGTEMYSGPGVGVYTEVYDGVLGIGTEGFVRESKGDWVRIELRNTQNGWVPADSIKHIDFGA
jgi:hypothetical protein